MPADEEDAFWNWWETICKKKGSGTLFSEFTPQEQALYAMNYLKGSVLRGGFHLYFSNAPCEEIMVAITALKTNGASSIAETIERARDVLFPDGIPQNPQEQFAQIPDWTDEEIENDIDPQWSVDLGTIEEDFYSQSEELIDLVANYFDTYFADE